MVAEMLVRAVRMVRRRGVEIFMIKERTSKLGVVDM